MNLNNAEKDNSMVELILRDMPPEDLRYLSIADDIFSEMIARCSMDTPHESGSLSLQEKQQREEQRKTLIMERQKLPDSDMIKKAIDVYGPILRQIYAEEKQQKR